MINLALSFCRQKSGEGPIEFTQYYHGRDDVAHSSINGLVKKEEDGLLYCPIPTASRRPSTHNTTPYPGTHRSSIGNLATHRSADAENVREVVTDRSDDVSSENSTGSSRRVNTRKLEKKPSTASMGIFAPPINPKPKTKYQRDKLLKKHSPTVMGNGINIEEEDVEKETTNAVNECKDVSIITNDTSKEANLKLTLPVLVAAKDKMSAEVCSDDHNETTAKSDEVKDKTYLTTADPPEGKFDKKTEDVTEIQIPELPKPRYDFDKAYSVTLPDIRINNYTVPSPIQEEDEEKKEFCNDGRRNSGQFII